MYQLLNFMSRLDTSLKQDNRWYYEKMSEQCDRNMMILYKNMNSMVMKTVGTVMFIRILLLIAGVERNPGPADVLVFRYQYLLIEVGTFLLRKLFDVQVKNDLVQFLKTNPNCAKQLKILIDNDVITDDQKNFLPPLDNNPDTANFDITLLTCLLRNICGLKHHRDPVWQKPSNGDLSVEAEITRVKECRNYVVHIGTVHISESDFNLKWKTLCQILFRLNNFCGVPQTNLSEMIDDASSKPLDDQLKQHHDNILKAWHEAESLFEKGIVHIEIRLSEMNITQSKLKHGQSEIKVAQSELKYGQSQLEKGQSEIKVTLTALMDGQSKLNDGQPEIKRTQSHLKDDMCEIKHTLSKLENDQLEMKSCLEKVEVHQKDNEIPKLKQHIGNVQKDLKNITKRLQTAQGALEETKIKLNNIEPACSSNKCTKYYTNEGIRQRLKKSYEKDFSTVSVTPLYSEDDRMDMLTVYTRPKMKHVPYHKARQSKGNYEISSYEQVFCKENTVVRNIFVTGDAGMGKTSFCQFMSLLWSKSLAGDIVGNENKKDIQADASFMTNFDFVFYILLEETNREDVVSMIVDKYFNTSSKNKFEETIQQIEQILETKKCLVILDGLDEWRPDTCGNRNLSLPRTLPSDKCTYLTTCRPYRIETVRLAEKDIDHQVQIRGFDHEKYIRKVVDDINKSQNTNKNPDHFLRQIKECGMDNQLHIPLITSQLIVFWFKYEMKNMTKAVIYGSILEMLFERAAIKNQIEFPSMASADVHLPESFSRFPFLRKYVGTLEKVCMLSFMLLFDPNNKTPSLVFTKHQLMSEPYNISHEEVDFLCQLGIISKNKVIASFGEQEHMLSFLHMSYLEFLAALFVSLYDKTSLFYEAVTTISIIDIGKYQNFLILLSGICLQKTRLFFENIYMTKREEFDLLRRGLFSCRKISPCSMTENVLSIIQNMVLRCLREIPDTSQRFIILEDFNIDEYRRRENLSDLKSLLVMNTCNVKSLITEHCSNEITDMKSLQYLAILSQHYGKYEIMLHNPSMLHSLHFQDFQLLSELPVRRLHNLKSIVFKHMTIKHESLNDLINYISSNILLENIVLDQVKCEEHESGCINNECNRTLHLSGHSNLLTVVLLDISLDCTGINTSCLNVLSVGGTSSNGYPRLMNPLNIHQSSQLKYLHLYGGCIHPTDVNNVINAIKSLKYINHLELNDFTIPDSASLQLHPDVVCDNDSYMHIYLKDVTMSDECFQEFIDSYMKYKSSVKLRFIDWYRSGTSLDSLMYRVRCVEAIPSLKVISYYRNVPINRFFLEFETRNETLRYIYLENKRKIFTKLNYPYVLPWIW